MSEPNAVDEGVARLESALAGTRQNAQRALRELHHAMSHDLRRAQRRADRAERRVAELRGKLQKARRRAKRARAPAGGGSAGARRACAGLLGRVRRKLTARTAGTTSR